MSRIKAFNRDRDTALRSLDRRQLEHFLDKWQQPRPRQWIGDAWLASIHKARLQLTTFSDAEKMTSRVWLAEHGYSEQIGGTGACPACGSQGPSNSDCTVCGVA